MCYDSYMLYILIVCMVGGPWGQSRGPKTYFVQATSSLTSYQSRHTFSFIIKKFYLVFHNSFCNTISVNIQLRFYKPHSYYILLQNIQVFMTYWTLLGRVYAVYNCSSLWKLLSKVGSNGSFLPSMQGFKYNNTSQVARRLPLLQR